MKDPRTRPGDALLFRHWITIERLSTTPTLRALVMNTMRALYLQAVQHEGERRWNIRRENDRVCFSCKVVKA